MEPNSSVYTKSVTGRLINLITRELQCSQQVMCDCNLFEQSLVRQESLCAQMHGMTRDIKTFVTEPGPVSGLKQDPQMRIFDSDALKQLRHALAVQKALLRRASRSLNVMMNVLSTGSADSYRVAHSFRGEAGPSV